MRRRVVLAQDAFVEILIWRVPEGVAPSGNWFRYRLAYVVGGQCVLRYDNEPGKTAVADAMTTAQLNGSAWAGLVPESE